MTKNVDAGKAIADEILRKVNTSPPAPFNRYRPVVGKTRRRGEAGDGPFLPMWGFLFYDWNEADPTDFAANTGIQCARMGMGYNYTTVWEPWLRARCAARGVPWSPGSAVGSPDRTEVRYYSAFSGGSRTSAGTFVELQGLIALEVAACFDVVVLGHSPAIEHVNKIKSLSQCGTKVLMGLHNFASINQRVDDYDHLEAVRQVSRGYPLTGLATGGWASNGLNQYGCTTVDWYEISGSGISEANWNAHIGTPSYAAGLVACPHDAGRHASLPANASIATSHTWECDVTDTEYQSIFPVEGLGVYVTDNYVSGGTSKIDGILVDNMLNNTYLAYASVAYPAAYTDAAYRAGWIAMMANWQTAINASSEYATKDFFRWANTADTVANYSATHIKNRWSENFFVESDGTSQRSKANVLAAITTAKSNNLRLVMGMTGTNAFADYWATTAGARTPATYGTWAEILSEVARVSAWNNVYAQALRQTSGGYVFWQEGFRPLP